MRLFEIKSFISGEVIFNIEAKNFRMCLQSALNSDADLRGADLRYADLRGADLRGADLRGADLRYADLRNADMRNADMRNADMSCANLRGADLRDAYLYFSCLPLSCGGTKWKVDDRFIGQLFFHITRMNTEGCSGGVKESVEHIKSMAISDLFCEYRNDVQKLEG